MKDKIEKSKEVLIQCIVDSIAKSGSMGALRARLREELDSFILDARDKENIQTLIKEYGPQFEVLFDESLDEKIEDKLAEKNIEIGPKEEELIAYAVGLAKENFKILESLQRKKGQDTLDDREWRKEKAESRSKAVEPKPDPVQQKPEEIPPKSPVKMIKIKKSSTGDPIIPVPTGTTVETTAKEQNDTIRIYSGKLKNTDAPKRGLKGPKKSI